MSRRGLTCLTSICLEALTTNVRDVRQYRRCLSPNSKPAPLEYEYRVLAIQKPVAYNSDKWIDNFVLMWRIYFLLLVETPPPPKRKV
jgi:hypothetical protein